MRTALIFCHRWLGLITGLIIVVVALTGAAISFEGAVRDAAAIRVATGPAPLSLDTIAAHALAGERTGRVVSIAFGTLPDQAYDVQVQAESGTTVVAVDPYSGNVLARGRRPGRAEAIVRKLHQVHTSLLGGGVGKGVVAFVALASLVLVLSGLVIWWRDRLWRIRWSASWKRVVFDLHHALGVAAAVVLVVISGTGVWMGYPDQVTPLVLRLNRTPVLAGRPKLPAPESGATEIPLDSMLRLAQATIPGARPILLQAQPGEPGLVALRYPEDATPGGRSRVFIDRSRGTILLATNTRTAETGTRLLNAQRPLHTGEIFGTWSQVVWLLASIVLASQGVTGAMMWWNGRAARRALALRAAATANAAPATSRSR